MTGIKDFPQFFIQSMRSKTRTNHVSLSHAFSRALRQLHVLTWSLDWFTGMSASPLVIGQSNYFGFIFATLNSRVSYSRLPWAEQRIGHGSEAYAG